jgi:hypothetical protein
MDAVQGSLAARRLSDSQDGSEPRHSSSESAAQVLLPSQESSDVLRILRLSTQFHELRGKFGASNRHVRALITYH